MDPGTKRGGPHTRGAPEDASGKLFSRKLIDDRREHFGRDLLDPESGKASDDAGQIPGNPKIIVGGFPYWIIDHLKRRYGRPKLTKISVQWKIMMDRIGRRGNSQILT